jgi:alanine racemase
MSYCLLNSKNFAHNIKEISQYISVDKIAFVLKNNAYGHGLLEMAELAEKNKIKHAVVINYQEAEKIASYFKSVLVLSGVPKFKPLNNISIAINDINDIKRIPPKTSVELKIDTGMHRNGILKEQLDDAVKLIDNYKLVLSGVFTHFSSAFQNDGSMEKQKSTFDDMRKKIRCHYPNRKIRFHCASSPGIFRLNNSDYDIARIGIAMYGYVDLPINVKSPSLKPVLSLWSEKISERLVKKGKSVGYGQIFKAEQDMTISTYDIGYGNGFFRLDENKKFNISDGREVIGRVSMNNLAIAGNDEEICIFDNVENLAVVHQTISYEILCRIDSMIERRIV